MSDFWIDFLLHSGLVIIPIMLSILFYIGGKAVIDFIIYWGIDEELFNGMSNPYE